MPLTLSPMPSNWSPTLPVEAYASTVGFAPSAGLPEPAAFDDCLRAIRKLADGTMMDSSAILTKALLW